jgi:RND family efflux transporter MFP subunit
VVAAGCGKQQKKLPESGPAEVIVSQAVAKVVTDYEEFTGRMDSPASVNVRARVTGYLDKVRFKEGSEVQKDDVLFEIDPRSYKAEYDRADANVKKGEFNVKSAEANVEAGKAKEREAEADLAFKQTRLRNALAAGRSVKTEERQEAQAAVETANAARARAKADVLVAVANVEVARADLKALEAMRNEAKLNLDYCRVLSPISGRISRQMIDPGNLVKANDTVLTSIVNLDWMYAYFDVDERTMLRARRLIQEGKFKSSREVAAEGETLGLVSALFGFVQPDRRFWNALVLATAVETRAHLQVQMGLADEEGFPHPGVLHFVDNQVDPLTGTLRVRGIFRNPGKFLSPGMFVRVRVPIGPPHPATLVPERALGTDQGQKFLYVVNDKKEIVYRRVKVGRLQEDGLRVIERGDKAGEGLAPGEWVVVNGLQRVRPGAQVEPKPEEKKPEDSPARNGSSPPALTTNYGSAPGARK